MAFLKKDGGRLVITDDHEKVIIEAWGRDSLRVRSTRQAQMPQEAWALTEPVEALAWVNLDENGAQVRNGRICAKVSTSGNIVFCDRDGAILLEEYVRTGGCDGGALNICAREYRPIPGGDYSVTVRFESDMDEKLYGMGQYQQPMLDLKGCELELAQRNSQASVPFVLSSKGYGFLWNNPAIGSVTFGKNLTSWKAVSTKGIDYWITAGDTPAQIEENYAAVTGKVPMMPDWAMGFWQCKLRYRTQDEILAVAEEYKRRGLPISVIVVDFFHWPLEGEWCFDPQYWPDPAGMVRELKKMGIELMVSIWPTVDFRSSNYREMKDRGLLIGVERGYPVTLPLLPGSRVIHVDMTNPEARQYLWEKVKKNYYDMGIRLFWLDVAEPEFSYYDFDNYRYWLGPDVQVGNIYPSCYSRGFYEGMEAEGQENIINLVRCAWAGSQKYGALVWSGDIHSTFTSLRRQFAAGLSMGIAGIPWWTTDIGGFQGGDIRDEGFRELLARWFEYGTFCPVMRLHGNRIPFESPIGDTGGGIMESGAPNEVWSFGEKNLEICTRYLFVRERMKPYITGLMRAAHEKGSPVMRTMFYEFPEDPYCWQELTQYMFGPELLVAPVMEAGATEKSVYLPEGTWYDVWTGEKLDGGRMITADAPIDVIPVFSRDEDLAKLLAGRS